MKKNTKNYENWLNFIETYILKGKLYFKKYMRKLRVKNGL